MNMSFFNVIYTPNTLGTDLGLHAGYVKVFARGTRDAISKAHKKAANDDGMDFRAIRHPDAHGVATALDIDGAIVGQFDAKRV